MKARRGRGCRTAPRSALLSIHARVEGTHAATWEDPSLVQVWGPRYKGDARMASGAVGRALGVHPGSLRYAAPTGTVLIRWDGGLLVDGELAGTWRRADATMTIQPWRPLSPRERDAVAAEAAALPLPGVQGRIVIRWDT